MANRADLGSQDLALRLRDAALRLVKKRGKPQRIGLFTYLILSRPGLRIAYRMPLQSRLQRTMDHGIEVWFGKRKVLAVEWNANKSRAERYTSGPSERMRWSLSRIEGAAKGA